MTVLFIPLLHIYHLIKSGTTDPSNYKTVLDSASNYYQPFCNSYVCEVATYQKIFWCFSFVNKIRIKYLQNKVNYFTLKHRRKDNLIQLTTMFLTLTATDSTDAINFHDTRYNNRNCLKTFLSKWHLSWKQNYGRIVILTKKQQHTNRLIYVVMGIMYQKTW